MGGEVSIDFKRRKLLFKFIWLRQVFPRRSWRREGGEQRHGHFPADFNCASLPPAGLLLGRNIKTVRRSGPFSLPTSLFKNRNVLERLFIKIS